MTKNTKKAMDDIKKLLDSERLSVLSTQKNGQPYASLVAFAFTEDLSRLLFLTPSTTRKYDNLTACPKVAMLVNNSRNRIEDIYDAASLTALGKAETVQVDAKTDFFHLYLLRHPHLKSFAEAPTTALVSILVDKYIMVNQFQNVIEIKMNS